QRSVAGRLLLGLLSRLTDVDVEGRHGRLFCRALLLSLRSRRDRGGGKQNQCNEHTNRHPDQAPLDRNSSRARPFPVILAVNSFPLVALRSEIIWPARPSACASASSVSVAAPL